jgi:chloride channel protein, CIC family
MQPVALVLTLPKRLAEILRNTPKMGETQRFLLLSIIIGIFAGLLVVCFHISIQFLAWNTVHVPGSQGWGTIFLPALGAAIASLLVILFFRTARSSGVNYTKAALYISDGYVPFSSVVGKFLASTVSIGSGNPMGPEDPALQMGAGVASLLGRLFHLTRENMRMIAPIGAAAGIGAAFNTPITAVLFVMEEVVASWNAGVLGSIVLSAVSAVVVSRWYLGDAPLFQVPVFSIAHPTELLVHALIGVVGGVLSAWFTRYTTRLRGHLVGLPRQYRYILPAAAGLLVGIVGYWFPGVLGAGYGTIDSAMHDQFTWQALLIFGGLKTLIVALCFSAGVPGGMFAPALFIGAMVGGGFGGLATTYSPLPTSSVGSYVLVGMGTFFAGSFRAPMTSVFMVFEVSASYVIILPAMIANTIAYMISRHMQHDSLFHTVGQQDGLDLPSVEEQREAPMLTVEDAMSSDSSRVLQARTTAKEALEKMQAAGMQQALVAADWGQWSWVDRKDLEKAIEAGQGEETVDQAVMARAVIRLYPDLSLDSAMRLLGPYPILPVSSRANSNRLLGTLTLNDVHRAYGLAKS